MGQERDAIGFKTAHISDMGQERVGRSQERAAIGSAMRGLV